MKLVRRSNSFGRVHDRFFSFSYPAHLAKIVMRSGKFVSSLKIVNDFLFILKKRYGYKNITQDLELVFDKYRPLVSFLDRKVAATTYNLPWFIQKDRSRSIIVRWFIRSSQERTEKGILLQMLGEFEDILKGVGRTVRKVEEFYEIAKRNRPFMRFITKKKGGRSSRLKKYGITHVRK